MSRFCAGLALLVVTLPGCLTPCEAKDPSPATDQIQWQAWSPDVFKQAKAQHRLVLLDLEAVWCHWCHVMDTKTYVDPAVIQLIQKNYIAVRVDQDSRPDLSNRYENYGWPATVIFSSTGTELAKRQGYLPPDEMGSILEAFVKDPTPGPSIQPELRIAAGVESSLPGPQRAQLAKLFQDSYDKKEGGWGFGQKFMDWNSTEYAMDLAQKGDASATTMARATLDAQVKLIDPVWGGVYQYSTDGDWDHPHFEKLIQFQAEDMRIYALASHLWPQNGYAEKAQAIEHYVDAFLTSPDGVFYVSQDADLIAGEHSADYFSLPDAERRKKGVPRIDTHIYARENGWFIQGLVAISNATKDTSAVEKAERAARWIVQQRSLPGGGFRHDATDIAGPYLGDTLAMGQGFLALYGATADRSWLARAEQAAGFIEQHFRAKSTDDVAVGYVTSATPVGSMFAARPLPDENIEMVRFANLLFHYTGDKRYRDMAGFAMSYVSSPAVIKANGSSTAGLLLADLELNSEPLHATIVGAKDDAKARELFQAALLLPGAYKQTEWLDRREGPLPDSDVSYPELKSAAAFMCTNHACSLPLSTPAELTAFVLR